jgi:DNA-binding NarL/FixJ family response regulator
MQDGLALLILESASNVQCLQEIARHLAPAWRTRSSLETCDACAGNPVVSLDSRPDPEAQSSTARQALRRAALAQDRGGTGRGAGGCGALWQQFVAGRWSLLDAFAADGARYVIACKTPQYDAALRALPEREHAVLESALAGRSGKWIALELGLSESTVARTLRMALRRLGVVDTIALRGVRNAVFEPLEDLAVGVDLAIARLPAVATAAAALSDAERAVVTGILGGKRVATIARERGTSPRTVSNQIASVYKKLGVSSRREAVALLA